ncbi:MAG: endonuclease [Flavobacteriaceae bacterium]|nr:MAG: endonuclease [Flavobacteriaceae bacterium]
MLCILFCSFDIEPILYFSKQNMTSNHTHSFSALKMQSKKRVSALLTVFLLFGCQKPEPNSTIVFEKKSAQEKSIVAISAPSTYYKSIDFSKSPKEIQEDLSRLITQTHTRELSYTPDVWKVLKKADLDLQDRSQVRLIYGSTNEDRDLTTDLLRDKDRTLKNNNNGWNREHVYAKSVGNPNLGTEGPGSDAHHLRASDEKQNAKRSNLPFTDGKGAAYKDNNAWYPGDIWKGDVARMLMYMYLRYGERCDPNRMAENPNGDPMPELFLKWNAEDPVDDFERQRNQVIANAQGNRNPFIDNPYLATLLWGGEPAQNTWEISQN